MDKVIAKFEGYSAKVYEDTKGLKTIGVGFNLEQPNGKMIFNTYLPGVSYHDVLSGKRDLTDDEIMSLFRKTLDDKIKTTRDIIDDYDGLPEKVQTALVNAVFRGEMKRTHKTVKLINEGKWSQVADEYIDRADYREASKPESKCRGIKIRMDYNANIFREYSKER